MIASGPNVNRLFDFKIMQDCQSGQPFEATSHLAKHRIVRSFVATRRNSVDVADEWTQKNCMLVSIGLLKTMLSQRFLDFEIHSDASRRCTAPCEYVHWLIGRCVGICSRYAFISAQ